MKQIKADLIESCKRNAAEFPSEIDPVALADGLEMMVAGICRLLSDAEKGEPTSSILGMDAAALDRVRTWCKTSVITKSKGDLMRGLLDLTALGWTRGEAIYAGYWIGLFEGGMR